MSFAAGIYAGIRPAGGAGGGGGGGEGQRRLFGLKKIDKDNGERGGGPGQGKDGNGGAQGAGAGIPNTAGPGSSGSGAGGVAGCVSGGRRACAALMFHALASVPLSRNKQEDPDDPEAKIDG